MEKEQTPEEIAKDQEEYEQLLQLVKESEINIGEKLSPAPDAMLINSKNKQITLFRKGDFSIVAGPPKAKKTFFICMLLAAAIKKVFQGMFFSFCDGMNILFDTEQSRFKSHEIAARICKLAEVKLPTNFRMFTLRSQDPQVRLKIIEEVLKSTNNIKFVVIDGIIDLDTDPIMMADQAQAIVSKLMKWTEIYQIHICCVLHYNKERGNGFQTLLGHLGSVAQRKAGSVIQVTKSIDNPMYSEVKAVDCREEEFEPFAFGINSDALPYILPEYSFEKPVKVKQEKRPTKAKIALSDFDSDHHDKILQYIFSKRKAYHYAEFWQSIKLAVESTRGTAIGDGFAKTLSTFYLNEKKITKTDMPGKKHPVYCIPGQTDLELNSSV